VVDVLPADEPEPHDEINAMPAITAKSARTPGKSRLPLLRLIEQLLFALSKINFTNPPYGGFPLLRRGRLTTVPRTAGILPACRRDGGVTKDRGQATLAKQENNPPPLW
jgi:hypothetical protein